MKKTTLTIITLVTIIIILAGIILYQNKEVIKTITPAKYKGVTFDNQCDQFPTINEKDACCEELHKKDPRPECIGDYLFRKEDKKCVFMCGGRELNPNI